MPPGGPRIVFSADGRFLITETFAPKVDAGAARKAKKKAAGMPKGGLAILALGTGLATRIENVKSFAMPRRGRCWLPVWRTARTGVWGCGRCLALPSGPLKA